MGISIRKFKEEVSLASAVAGWQRGMACPSRWCCLARWVTESARRRRYRHWPVVSEFRCDGPDWYEVPLRRVKGKCQYCFASAAVARDV